MTTGKPVYAAEDLESCPLYKMLPQFDKQVIASALGQLRIIFTCISKFSKFPSSLRDSGNFVKTLKVLVKLILNCPRPHAITYTAMGSELFSCSPFREIYQNFAPKCNFVLLPISFPLGNFIRYDHFVTRKCSKFTNSLTVLSSHTSVDE